MAETLLWTYQDAVEWVLDGLNANEPNTGAANRLARKAVQEAYRDLANAHRWRYSEKKYTIFAVAPYSTGTVTYDHTGGANERMLTLATGTWPSWAAFGKVIIDGIHYTVATRESDSIITLSPSSNPGEDVAAGTTYELYRDTYPLPVDFMRMRKVINESDTEEILPLPPDEAHWNTSVLQSPGDPLHYSIHGDGEYYGSLGFVLSPPPSADDYFTLWYDRSLRPLKTYLYSTGTVAVSAGATSVTLTGGTFDTTRHLGAIIRFSSTSTVPTSDHGTIAGVDNPYIAQRVITALGSTTSLTIDAAASTGALSGVGFTISDPLDFEHQAMLTAFLAMAEASFMRLTNNKLADSRAALAMMRLKEAMAYDYRSREMFSAGGGDSDDDGPSISRFSTVHLSEQ